MGRAYSGYRPDELRPYNQAQTVRGSKSHCRASPGCLWLLVIGPTMTDWALRRAPPRALVAGRQNDARQLGEHY